MNRLSHRAVVVVLLSVAAVSGYFVYVWWPAAPSRARKVSTITPPMTEQRPVSSSRPAASAPPNLLPVTESLQQLHFAFRESQRCVEERLIIRGNDSYNLDATLPPHISGCDDLKSALRNLLTATTAAAKAGDVDAQMCMLTQSGGDLQLGFTLSDAEIAEWRSPPSYVDAAFKRGDWRVVELLGFHIVDSVGLFIELEQWKDSAREYKAHQLLLLGADDAVNQDADYWLISGRMSETTLSAQEIREVDAWAHKLYDQYFSSQPKLIKEPTVCAGTDDPA